MTTACAGMTHVYNCIDEDLTRIGLGGWKWPRRTASVFLQFYLF